MTETKNTNISHKSEHYAPSSKYPMSIFISEKISGKLTELLQWFDEPAQNTGFYLSETFVFNLQKNPAFEAITIEKDKNQAPIKKQYPLATEWQAIQEFSGKNRVVLILIAEQDELTGWEKIIPNNDSVIPVLLSMQKIARSVRDRIGILYGYTDWPAKGDLTFLLSSLAQCIDKQENPASQSIPFRQQTLNIYLWDQPDMRFTHFLRKLAAVIPFQIHNIWHAEEIHESLLSENPHSMCLINLDNANMDSKKLMKQILKIGPTYMVPIIGIKMEETSLQEILRGHLKRFMRYVFSPVEWTGLFCQIRYHKEKRIALQNLWNQTKTSNLSHHSQNNLNNYLNNYLTSINIEEKIQNSVNQDIIQDFFHLDPILNQFSLQSLFQREEYFALLQQLKKIEYKYSALRWHFSEPERNLSFQEVRE